MASHQIADTARTEARLHSPSTEYCRREGLRSPKGSCKGEPGRLNPLFGRCCVSVPPSAHQVRGEARGVEAETGFAQRAP